MNYQIPLSYNLNIYDLFNDSNEIICYYIYEYKIYNFSNFSLYTNKRQLIYKITSTISLEYLLDFLNNYENIIIKKIYYFLIIKYLLKQNKRIYKECYFNCCTTSNDFYDLIVRTRDYHICHNNQIIITDYLYYNICLIIINETSNKSFITIIDRNCIIDNLYELIISSNLYINSRFENIQIGLIGGSIDNVDIIINIYKILKELKLSKYINRTYLFKSKPIKRLCFNSYNKNIYFIKNNSRIVIEPERDNSNHILNNHFFSNLNRI